MSVLKYWLWLSDAPVSTRAKAALIRRYGDAETAYFAPAGEFASIEHVTPAEAAILERRDLSRTDAISRACLEQNISIVTLQDAAYPKRLKSIYDPPVVLYVKGKLPVVDDNALVAVIGTRKASSYGLKMAQRLAFEVSKCGGIVVSGLTAGIDAQAAKGAMLAGAACVAVLGSSHEQSNSPITQDVELSGAVISEYAPGTIGRKSFFRDRNRIGAGLSVATVVVEAPEKSGALLFAQEAAEQGREVFAVPGNADSLNSAGTIALLKSGAKPVTEGWDVLCEFVSRFPDKLHPAEKEELPEPVSEEKPQSARAAKISSAQRPAELKAQLDKLNEPQLKIITAIDSDTNHIDDIMEATGLSSSQVLTQLTLLEIKGYVRRLPGNRVALNIAKK
ncbi:MAG: DNA-protecting protein DprA [Oscillospiraceae bacterium]|nr:DNA-protecting protein DprA [Oscillospiraceae bacterium]